MSLGSAEPKSSKNCSNGHDRCSRMSEKKNCGFGFKTRESAEKAEKGSDANLFYEGFELTKLSLALLLLTRGPNRVSS